MPSANIGGVEVNSINNNKILSSDNSNELLPMYIDEKITIDDKALISFIKGVERFTRTSNEYRSYIRYLKEELTPPLDRCMVYSNITDENATIEMHHGPIFTLFDYVEIIMLQLLKQGQRISTPRLSYYLLEEHRMNRIQVVMLSEFVHKGAHTKDPKNSKFIDYRMAHGDIVSFLNKYYLGLSFRHVNKIKRYFEVFKKKSGKNKFFEEFITKWNKDN